MNLTVYLAKLSSSKSLSSVGDKMIPLVAFILLTDEDYLLFKALRFALTEQIWIPND